MASPASASIGQSPSNRKRAKGKTAASLALFPSADDTFNDLLPRYPVAAGLLRDPAPLRKGKWSKEEDDLANTCIQHFMEGLIPLSGIGDDTLRGLLSYMLHSDGMRVTKKFAGELSIRKQQYVALSKQARACKGTPRAVEAAGTRQQMAERFLQSLESRSAPRRRPAGSSSKARGGVTKRRRPGDSTTGGNSAKAARGDASDDSTLAVEMADAAAHSMAHVYGFVPAHGFRPGVPVSFAHPASRPYPFASGPAAVPSSAQYLSSYGDEHHRPLPAGVVPMMPSMRHDGGPALSGPAAIFARTPPPGAHAYAPMPTVFQDASGTYRQLGPPQYHPMYAHANPAFVPPASMPPPGAYFRPADGPGRYPGDPSVSAPMSSGYFASTHSPLPPGVPFGPDGRQLPAMAPHYGAHVAVSTGLVVPHPMAALAGQALRDHSGPRSLAAAAALVESASSPSPAASSPVQGVHDAAEAAGAAAAVRMGVPEITPRTGGAGSTTGHRTDADADSLGDLASRVSPEA